MPQTFSGVLMTTVSVVSALAVSGTRLWIDPSLDLAYVYLSGAWGMSREPIDVVEAAVYAGLSSIA